MAIRSLSKYVRRAEKKLAQLEKKQGLRPVIIEGSVIRAPGGQGVEQEP